MAKTNKKSVKDFFDGAEAGQQKKKAQERARRDKAAADKAAVDDYLAEQHRKRREVFADFYEDVAPILGALDRLPPKGDNEFFVRADLNVDGWDPSSGTRGPEINMWILYTRRATDADYKEVLPPIHSISISEKNTVWEDNKDARLYVNEVPVFRVRSKPQRDGTMKIDVQHYAIEYQNTGRRTAGSGSYRTGKDGNYYRETEWVTERSELTNLRDLTGAIGAWVSEAAPERLGDLRHVLNGGDPEAVRDKIIVSKPIIFKKPAP